VTQYAKELPREAYRKETSVGGVMEFAGQTVVSVVGGELGKTLPLNKNENAELNIFLPTSDTFGTIASVFNIAAPILALIPQFHVHATPLGVGGAAGFGGQQLSKGAKYAAEGAKLISDTFRSSADRAAKMASYYRRAEDYVLQANVATSELQQYGRQIISALLREQILKHEYDNQVKQIENAEALEAFLRDKFTNEDLYTWMEGELSQTYYECYKLAFDVAKRAEQTLKHELMRPEFDELDIIKFGYWNGARKGLLAGETLSLDVKRLERVRADAPRLGRPPGPDGAAQAQGDRRVRADDPGMAVRSRQPRAVHAPAQDRLRLDPGGDRPVHRGALQAVAPAQQRARLVAARRPVRA
jgi:hypothetical protein